MEMETKTKTELEKKQERNSLTETHVTDPLGEGRGASEHRGLHEGVASLRGDEAGHTLQFRGPPESPFRGRQKTSEGNRMIHAEHAVLMLW